MATLALIEPAWIGRGYLPRELEVLDRALHDALDLPDEQLMSEFTRLNSAPGAQPPATPPGPRPDWMARRPAGLRALIRAFDRYDLDRDRFQTLTQPVYLAAGGRSHWKDMWMCETLAGLFPNSRLEVYEERAHFDPPRRAEPARFAAALWSLWAEDAPNAEPMASPELMRE